LAWLEELVPELKFVVASSPGVCSAALTSSSAGVSSAWLEELVPELRSVVASSPGVCSAALTPSSAGVSSAWLEELVPELKFVVASSPGVCSAALDDPMPEPRFTTAVEVVCGRGALGLGVVTPRPLVVPLLADGAEAAVGVVWASSALGLAVVSPRSLTVLALGADVGPAKSEEDAVPWA